MRKFSADYIFTGADFIPNGILIVDDSGIVQDLYESGASLDNVEKFEGVICPGFVNTHCHLELSYLLNKIPTKTGLNNFLSEIEKNKNSSEEKIVDALINADLSMKRNGIVAVGDISNTGISFKTKVESTIKYHTFIEVFAFHP